MRNYVTPYEEFGCEVNDGWLPIVEKIPDLVEQYNRNRLPEDQLEIFQIKSKFGELRVYICRRDDETFRTVRIPGLDEEIENITEQCSNTCEWCGSTENVTTSAYEGWVRTLCNKCNEELRTK